MARPLIVLVSLLLTACFHGQSYTPQRTVSTWREMRGPSAAAGTSAPAPAPAPGQPLTAYQAYALAIAGSPELAAAEARVEVAEAGIQAARQLDNPQLRLTNFNVDDVVNNKPGMNIGLRVPIPRPGTIHAKVEGARLGAEGQRGLAEDTRRQLRARIFKLYARMAMLRADLEQHTRAGQLRGGQRDEIGARASASVATDLDVALAEVAHVQSLDQAARIEGEMTRVAAELQRILGATEPPTLQVDPGELKLRDLELDRDALTERAMGSRPELRMANTLVGQAQAEVYLARSEAYPWFDWAQVQYRAGPNANASSWGFGVAMTLPVFSLNRGAIKASRALVRQREFEERAQIAAVASEVGEAVERVEQTARRVKELETKLLPQIETATRAAGAALAAGALDPVTASTVATRMVEARRTHIAALLEHREAVIDLETAIGGAITPAPARGPRAADTP
jgi:outer membrane protein TolC